ncbi:MAG: 4Fe-4S dicluster domain-containing protein [Rikenellaceae bacterium]|nr:4Fe-4S dicluster domain-containing protein [Rikenellaceae bacterium]MDE7355278.1 4Fe-4S dicluster domain-containing protein [Rikenellaceae bacterium]
MGKYFDILSKDVRFVEGMNACMNCGMCTAVCPAAEFYNYDPRQIMDTVQNGSEQAIERLLSGEQIWYCGECMSCRPRCPRGNTPGYVIQALRKLSQETGLFVKSEKGRQQLALKRTIGQNILDLGYCIHPTRIMPEMHPEQGPVWEWVFDHVSDVFTRFDMGYDTDKAGAMRRVDDESLDEIRRIFDQTGGTAFFDMIEEYSAKEAERMGMSITEDGRLKASDRYFEEVYTANNGEHTI